MTKLDINAKVKRLNFLVREYEGITSLITATKQRLLSLPGDNGEKQFDDLLKGRNNEEGLETIKGRALRQIEKELKFWDVWTEWLKDFPGIGGYLAARLIIFFNYRFVPICKDCGGKLEREEGTMICQDCGKKAKDDGLLEYTTEKRDFPTISKWWAFMGRHTVDGNMPKRKKGQMSNWSTPGRTIGFHIGDQFNRQKEDNPYKKFMLDRKRRHEKNHEDWTKGHIHNAARNETVKLFLSHFWTVSRLLDGKPVSAPYAGALMGHTNIVQPFFWDDPVEFSEKN